MKSSFVLSLLLASTPLALPAHAAAIRPALSPMDVFSFEDAVDPQISPNGRQVLYVRSGYDIAKDGRRGQLWIVDADGKNAKPLTAPAQMAGNARWSPDGSRIAYVTTRDGAPRIVIRWMAGGSETETEIGNLAASPENLSWSPDGRQIAFTMLVGTEPRRIGTPPTPPPGADWKPQPMVIDRTLYRADGIGYFPPGRQQFFIVPSDGGTPRRVTNDAHDYGAPPLSGALYDWLPDGKALAVQIINKTEDEIVHGKFFDSGLYRLALEDGSLTPIVDGNGPEGSPSVSPDGRWIAYTGYEEKGEFQAISQLSIINPATGERRLLSADLDRDVEMPRWSPDGKGIYGFYADGGITRLALFDIRGRRHVVAQGLGMAHTAYSAAPSYTVARDGSFVLQSSSPTSTGNIAVGAPGKPLRQITTLNDALLAERALGRVERIGYTSAADGLPIEGWIIYPPNFDPKRKYPLILEIHGGPNASYGERFDLEKQIMASAGYVVLYVNPRGSTAYGRTFVNLIQDKFPGDEYDDLMSGVDAVIARGFIDPAHLYVTGGSGGGTLTAWVTARSTRFRAAAVLYPVIDWQSQALTSDILPLVFNGFFHGTPWNQPADYQRRSLLRSVDKVKTPTLVMGGEADYRTPISEAEQYYAALRYFGVESAFIRYPLENHGLRMFPSHFAAKVAHMIGWFKEHE